MQRIWAIVDGWNYFAKDTVGKQLVRSADSVGANISEGFGRYFYKENKRFCDYARGSLKETQTWIEKAHHRGLMGKAEYESLEKELTIVVRTLNRYIASIGPRPSNK